MNRLEQNYSEHKSCRQEFHNWFQSGHPPGRLPARVSIQKGCHYRSYHSSLDQSHMDLYCKVYTNTDNTINNKIKRYKLQLTPVLTTRAKHLMNISSLPTQRTTNVPWCYRYNEKGSRLVGLYACPYEYMNPEKTCSTSYPLQLVQKQFNLGDICLCD